MESERYIIINLNGIKKIDSVGLSYLYGINKTLKSKKGRLILSNPINELDKVFKSTKLDQHIPIIKKNETKKTETVEEWYARREERQRRMSRYFRR